MHDRACQALVKMTLEPEWEAKFEPGSYGFRPGRSAHDAIKNIFMSCRKGRKWILDADISGCFDNIDHEALLSRLNTFPELRRTIKIWLKAGYLDGNVFNRTDKGTPQGGVISPLLAHIALHGLEEHIEVSMMQNVDHPRSWYAKYGPLSGTKGSRISPKVIRYADDFVIIYKDKDVIEDSKIEVAKWLAGVGLELKDSKTEIRHSSEGFDFLGFTIRQFDTSLNKIGFKTIVKPSKKSVLRHSRALKLVLRQLTTAPVDSVIKEVNPIIRGWSNYFKTVSSRKTFERCDDMLNHQLRRWVDRRHHSGKRGYKKKSYGKYFRTISGNQWRFVSTKGNFLMMHSEHAIKYHDMVTGNRSPYDGDTTYWATRLGRSVEISPRIAWLLKSQKGRCKTCQLHFDHESIMEVHHIDGNHKNDKWKNLALLHGHCHDSAHSANVQMTTAM
jgi:RNA-directed DNA polymerase